VEAIKKAIAEKPDVIMLDLESPDMEGAKVARILKNHSHTATIPIVVWTVSIIATYVQWHLRALGHPWGALPGWVMLLEYGCVAMAGAMIALRRHHRPRELDT